MAFTTIDDPSVYFQTLLYTGNGSSSRALTNTGNSDLQPDWLWIKNRGNATTHGIWDSSRGAGKRLTIATDAEEDQTNVASFNSDGFTVNTGDIVNTNTHTYVAFCWNGGSAAVAETAVLPKVKPPSGMTTPLPDKAVKVFAVNLKSSAPAIAMSI